MNFRTEIQGLRVVKINIYMKKIYNIFCFALLLFLIGIALFGCATKKVQTQLKESETLNEAILEITKSDTEKSVDTTKVSSVETNTVMIVFFNPNEVSDYEKLIELMKERGEPFSDYGLVKSIVGTTSKVNETQSGISNEKNNTTVDTQKKSNIEIKKEEITKTETVSFWNKNKWYFISFGVIIICLVFFIIIKKSKLII